jgi:nucleotide-binding universal stress UspA family protein
MLRRIMVPLDGSARAVAALPTALLLGRRDEAQVHLVRVHEPLLPAAVPGDPPGYDPTLDQEVQCAGRRYLDVLLGRIDAQDRARTVTAYLHGPVTRALGAYIEDRGIDLVVMTTHGRRGGSRAVLGSVADGLVRRSHVPVLLLQHRMEAAPAPATTPAFRRVLLPVAGTPTDDQTIERAIVAAGTYGVEYRLLRVIPPGAQRAPVQATLEARAEALRARGLAVQAQVTVDEDAAHEIRRYAAANDVDLIAMATRSRGGLERLLFGSVADRVLHEAEAPLLLWYPAAEAAGEPVQATAAAGT